MLESNRRWICGAFTCRMWVSPALNGALGAPWAIFVLVFFTVFVLHLMWRRLSIYRRTVYIQAVTRAAAASLHSCWSWHVNTHWLLYLAQPHSAVTIPSIVHEGEDGAPPLSFYNEREEKVPFFTTDFFFCQWHQISSACHDSKTVGVKDKETLINVDPSTLTPWGSQKKRFQIHLM